MTNLTPTPKPTQVVHPWKATLRTAVQTFLGAAVVMAVVAPELQNFIAEWWPESPVIVWIGVGSTFIASVAALITRIMAIPAVNQALTAIGLGAETKN